MALDSELPFDPDRVYRGPYPSKRGLFTKQPFKLLWATAAILLNAAQLPFWLLYYLIPRFRPNPKWSLQNAMFNHIVSRHIYHTGAVGAVTPLKLTPGLEGARVEVVHPSRKNVYVDTCVDSRGVVKPVPLPGVWSPARPKPGAAPKRTILHFHGGAFVIGDPRLLYSGHVSRVLNKNVAPQVVAAGYRLSSNPEGYFPAQLQDAVTWWFSLLESGIPADQIVLSGDSAGGNLAYTLLRYMELHRDLFPVLPAAVLLWSPWVDMVSGFHPEEIIKAPAYVNKTDYIVPNFPNWGATTMCVNYDATDPWLSPLRGQFVTSVPIFIQVGTCEILYPDITLFYKKLNELEEDGKKNKVEIHIAENCNHDIVLLGMLMGFSKECKAACDHARRFLDENTSTKSA